MYRYAIKYLIKTNIFKKLKDEPLTSKMITFNDALVKEIFSIKFKLDQLLIDKDEWHKKSKDLAIERDRKSFLIKYYAYSDYNSIVERAVYKTSNGDHGSIIIFKQKSTDKEYGRHFDVFDHLNKKRRYEGYIGEEILIQLHSAGPKSY